MYGFTHFMLPFGILKHFFVLIPIQDIKWPFLKCLPGLWLTFWEGRCRSWSVSCPGGGSSPRPCPGRPPPPAGSCSHSQSCTNGTQWKSGGQVFTSVCYSSFTNTQFDQKGGRWHKPDSNKIDGTFSRNMVSYRSSRRSWSSCIPGIFYQHPKV